MTDNWNGDGGWKTNIMEGPHGGGRSFSEDWAEWTWGARLGFIATMMAVAAFFVGMTWLLVHQGN